MSNLLVQDQAALRMLFGEDLYLVSKKVSEASDVSDDKSNALKNPEPIQDTRKTSATEFEYLGDNNKYFLILINDPIHTRISQVHQEMLMKVMSAKKLELRDLAIVNISRYYEADFNALKAFFTCSKLVLFGMDPKKIGLPAFALNKTEQKGHVNILATYGLEEMRNSPDKKREFWNVMKNF